MTQTVLQSILFIGLGNPGADYAMTRHNMGYLVIEAFARSLGWLFKEDRRFKARVVKGVYENKTVHLVLPLTYMNLSGTTVRCYVDYFKIPMNSLVVVTDDIALAFGQLRLRILGSAGGHNGLKSIEESLGSSQYMRLRMGIGHPGEKMLANYVLETFNQVEQQELPTFIDQGVEVLKRLINENPSHVMNGVNTISHQIKTRQEKSERNQSI